MKPKLYQIALIVLSGMTIGSVYAATSITEVPLDVINGELRIFDGNLVVNRDDLQHSFWSIKNSGAANVLNFHDLDDNEQIQLRLTSTGHRFDMFDVDDNAIRFALLTDTGNVGIGVNSPTQKLDVDGNIRLTGNIVSPNDICIGNCP